LPPQLAAKCVKRDKRPLLLSTDSREMKLDRLLKKNVYMMLVASYKTCTELRVLSISDPSSTILFLIVPT